jgi:major intracellular serine protease
MKIIDNVTTETMCYGTQIINAVSQWTETQGEEINIALLDSGVDYNHSDLRDRIRGGINLVNDDPQDYIDRTGHGTFCAGIIAANLNGSGMVGIAPLANIYPVKILNDDNVGSALWLKQGLHWCLNNNIHIISMSIGFKQDIPQIHDLIRVAKANNIILVAAVGNDSNCTEPEYPAAYEEVFGVSAIDPQNRIASFSNTGSGVDYTAPGVDIMSTYLNNKYAIMSGTSFAAPHVVGAAALIQSKALKTTGKLLTPEEVSNQLNQNIIDLGMIGRDNFYGYGCIHF